jgi:two-component system, chemotaxis family, response regulator Rcp1
MQNEISAKPFRILIADDDFEDFLLIKNTFEANQLNVHLSHVEDGQYLIDILKAQGKYNKFGELPNLILLDLNMPRKNGFDVLKEIKENEQLKKIPIIIFTTSKTARDIDKAYELGANCYISKPQTVEEWTDIIHILGRFWIQCVKLAV